MAANRSEEDDKNLKILRELITQEGNKYCLDCNQRGPTYVNTTIGSFVCSKCSGMLRGLTPPHRVKSISMATFTPEEIEFIKSRGNQYCKRVWLGLYEGESVNFADEQSVRDFMSDKYEKKRYYLESSLTNNSVATNGSSKNKSKGKSGTTTGNPAQLISISSQATKQLRSSNLNAGKVINSSPTGSECQSSKLARPVISHSQPPLNSVFAPPSSVAAPPSIPDFPVDFSTAEIYNSSQYSCILNNNVPPQSTGISFNNLSQNSNNTSTANDRYAALADLDMAFRQENMKHLVSEEKNDNCSSKNPFQSTTSDLFANKNPFFNGGWNVPTVNIPANPFMPSMNNGNIVNSKNPFL